MLRPDFVAIGLANGTNKTYEVLVFASTDVPVWAPSSTATYAVELGENVSIHAKVEDPDGCSSVVRFRLEPGVGTLTSSKNSGI